MNEKQFKVGNSTEKNIAKECRKLGYWVHRMPTSTAGQCVDFIIVRENDFFIFDAKHIRKEEISFPFSRVESNQITSMAYMRDFAKINKDRLGFVLYFERIDKYLWFPYETYLELKRQGHKSVNADYLLHNEIGGVFNNGNNNHE